MTKIQTAKKYFVLSLSVILLIAFLTQCNSSSQPTASSSNIAPSNTSSVTDASDTTSVTSNITYPSNYDLLPYEEKMSVIGHDFYIDEYKYVRDSALNVYTENGFSFVLLSDTHIDYEGGEQPERPVIEREIETILELAKTAKIDCVILGGDLIHGTGGHFASVTELEFFASKFKDCAVPVLVARGNHDPNDYHGDVCNVNFIIDQTEWVDTLVDPVSKGKAVHDPNNPKSSYYYMDFPEKKTRVIVIDCYNYPVVSTKVFGISDWRAETWDSKADIEQWDWLASEAISADLDGWKYVLASHTPITSSHGFPASDIVKEIVSALNNGSKYTLSNGTVVNYSNYNSYIPLAINGHTHVSSSKQNEDGKYLQIGVGSGKVSNRRKFGDISEATFDLISLSDHGQAYRFDFGAGKDEQFDISKYIKQ